MPYCRAADKNGHASSKARASGIAGSCVQTGVLRQGLPKLHTRRCSAHACKIQAAPLLQQLPQCRHGTNPAAWVRRAGYRCSRGFTRCCCARRSRYDYPAFHRGYDVLVFCHAREALEYGFRDSSLQYCIAYFRRVAKSARIPGW